MKIIESVLDYPVENSIYVKNLNPLRLSMQLYKIIDDIYLKYNYSEYVSNTMKDTLVKQIVRVLEIYKDTDEMTPIMRLPDIQGRNCFWFFRNYELFEILDAKIMDKFVLSQWIGNDNVNSTIMDYSANYFILKTVEFKEYKVLSTMYSKGKFNLYKGPLNHSYKFSVYKKNMALRYTIEGVFTMFLTIAFSIYITRFN